MMTGGVARNEGIVRVLEEKLGTRICTYQNMPSSAEPSARALIAME